MNFFEGTLLIRRSTLRTAPPVERSAFRSLRDVELLVDPAWNMESSGSTHSLEFCNPGSEGSGALGNCIRPTWASLSSASLFSVDIPFRILTEVWSSIATLRGVELELVDRIDFSYTVFPHLLNIVRGQV